MSVEWFFKLSLTGDNERANLLSLTGDNERANLLSLTLDNERANLLSLTGDNVRDNLLSLTVDNVRDNLLSLTGDILVRKLVIIRWSLTNDTASLMSKTHRLLGLISATTLNVWQQK